MITKSEGAKTSDKKPGLKLQLLMQKKWNVSCSDLFAWNTGFGQGRKEVAILP